MKNASLSKEESLKILMAADESGVTPSRININFKCPYSFMLIQTPVRGKFCQHPGCFDLRTYIEMQRYEEFG